MTQCISSMNRNEKLINVCGDLTWCNYFTWYNYVVSISSSELQFLKPGGVNSQVALQKLQINVHELAKSILNKLVENVLHKRLKYKWSVKQVFLQKYFWKYICIFNVITFYHKTWHFFLKGDRLKYICNITWYMNVNDIRSLNAKNVRNVEKEDMNYCTSEHNLKAFHFN